ncbi:AAA family ATPase [Alcaligenes faecalis]|uniref:AAA family ATPase n=1 Tax=Alcaligenes faecalis TaxID=511 RepID=UPI000A322330|nr:AAA family ATPase [Alcaligenes faecalis]
MKLTVAGYKSIGEARAIDVKGLTILSGANSSGKSSFMQPLLLIKQTLENEFDAGGLLLDGPNVRVTDSTQIVSRVDGSNKEFMSIDLEEATRKTSVSYKFRQRLGIHAAIITIRSNDYPNGLEITPNMSSSVIEEMIKKSGKDFPFPKIFKGQRLNYKIVRDRCFLDVGITLSGEKLPFTIGISPASPIGHYARRLIHVPGLRGNPERSYKTAASENKFPGSFERYVASIVHAWRTTRRHKAKFVRLVEQMNALGLASSLGTTPINDTRLEITISRYRGESVSSKDFVNIADVGFGVSQTLPVLVALLTADKGQIVYIEQPELHLHPRAQYKLAEIIAEAVNRGVLVVIETHSSILIRGVQTLVAKGKMDRDVISLNWFTQSLSCGQSEISSAKLDEYGAFGDWPEDFDTVALDAEGAYLDAVEEASRAS